MYTSLLLTVILAWTRLIELLDLSNVYCIREAEKSLEDPRDTPPLQLLTNVVAVQTLLLQALDW